MLTPTARALLGLLVLLVAGAVVYLPALDRVFVYDDILVVRDNKFVTDPANLLEMRGETYLRAAGENTYRPLVTATYIADHAVWGKSAFGYGLTNLLLQVLAAWLLGLLVRRLVPTRPWLAGLSALLYLWHPALVEVVISPGNREEALSVVLILLCAWCWRRGRDGSRGAGWLSPVALLASLHTMEWGVAMPALLACWAWIEGHTARESLTAVWREIAATAIFLALYLGVYPSLSGETAWLGGGPWGGLLAFASLFWRYVRLAALPVALRPSYTFAFPALAVSLVALSAMVAVGASALWGLARRRVWALGVIVFFLGLAPVSHVLMPFWIAMAERYLAVPLLGAAPLLAFAATFRRGKTAVVLSLLLAGAFALGAAQRAHDWQTPLSLWSNAIESEPEDPVSWTNYAAGLSAYARYDEAADAHRHALELAQRQGGETGAFVLNVAREMEKADRSDRACDFLLSHHAEKDKAALATVGRLCRRSRPEIAADAYRRLLAEKPDYCAAWAGFCALDPGAAPGCLQKAVEHCPDDGRIWLHVAALHAAAGNSAKLAAAAARAWHSPQRDQLRQDVLRLLLSARRRIR